MISAVAALPGPYPGLRPFTEAEASIFFGRQKQCETLSDLLEERNLLLIHGSSGCGKSSLVAAGLLPLLQRDYRRAGQVLRSASFRPSSGPYEGLARALAEALGAPGQAEDASDSHEGSHGVDNGAYGQWGGRLLDVTTIIATVERRMEAEGVDGLCLIVDQFEEIFSWIRDRRPSDVDRLVEFLAAVRQSKSERVFVLLTMRSDFIGACGQFRPLAEAFNDSQYLLPALGVADIAEAIVRPAAMFNGAIKPTLLDRLLVIASTGPDPLPIVQHALKRMVDLGPRDFTKPWELTLEELAIVSQDSNPLSRHADEIAQRLEDGDPAAAQAIEWIFRALFDVEKSGETIRRPRDFGQLVAVTGLEPPANMEQTTRIVEAFSAEGANLLVVSHAEPKRVDIAHEALLRQWTRISGGGKDEICWKRREVEDGQMWRSLASPLRAGDLLRRQSLDLALAFFARMRAAPERARRYLAEETSITDPGRAREWRAIASLIRRSQNRRRLIWVGMATAGLTVVLGALIYSVIQFDIEKKNRALAERQLAAKSKSIGIRDAGTAIGVIASDLDGPTAGSETLDAQNADILAKLSNQTFDRSGYVWIGTPNGSFTTLMRLKDRVPAPDGTILKDNCYTPRVVLALRSGMPDALNRSASRIAALQPGQRICALNDPRPAPSGGQKWLHVATATIYFQVTGKASAKLDRIREKLRGYNYFLTPVQELPLASRVFDVRYCNADDEQVAQLLARYMDLQLPGHSFTLRRINNLANCAKVPPGVFEVWLDTASLGADT